MHKKKRVAMIKHRKRQNKLKLRRKMFPVEQPAPAPRMETATQVASTGTPRAQETRKAPGRARSTASQRGSRTGQAATQRRASGTRRRQTKQTATESAEETPE